MWTSFTQPNVDTFSTNQCGHLLHNSMWTPFGLQSRLNLPHLHFFYVVCSFFHHQPAVTAYTVFTVGVQCKLCPILQCHTPRLLLRTTASSNSLYCTVFPVGVQCKLQRFPILQYRLLLRTIAGSNSLHSVSCWCTVQTTKISNFAIQIVAEDNSR